MSPPFLTVKRLTYLGAKLLNSLKKKQLCAFTPRATKAVLLLEVIDFVWTRVKKAKATRATSDKT